MSEESADRKKRSFQVVDPCHCGRYLSSTPAGAAGKAFTQLCVRGDNKCDSLTVTLRETTRGKGGKTYKYKVTRESIAPRQVNRGGETITYNYTTKVKSLN